VKLAFTLNIAPSLPDITFSIFAYLLVPKCFSTKLLNSSSDWQILLDVWIQSVTNLRPIPRSQVTSERNSFRTRCLAAISASCQTELSFKLTTALSQRTMAILKAKRADRDRWVQN